MPELPEAKRTRFEQEYQLAPDDARMLTETPEHAAAFEEAAALSTTEHATAIARWLIGDVAALLNQRGPDASLEDLKLTPAHIAELVELVEGGAITGPTAKEVLHAASESGEMPKAIVEARGLGRVDDAGELDGIATSVIEANPKAVEDYRGGKDSAIKFLVGQVMRETRGRSDPNTAADVLRKHLDGG